MEFIASIVLWREVVTVVIVLALVIIIRAVDNHVRVRDPRNLQIVSTLFTLAGLLLAAHLMRAPLVGVIGGLSWFVVLIKLLESPPRDSRYTVSKTTAQ